MNNKMKALSEKLPHKTDAKPIRVLYSHVVEKSNGLQKKLSVENESRVNIPVEHLENNHQITPSSILNYSHSLIVMFWNLTYSTEYINKMMDFRFNSNICGSCSFATKKSKCDICDNSTCVGHYLDNDTLITPTTKYALIESAKVLMSIVDSDDNYAYALIRPPGHHSCVDHHEGFCIFNNVIMLYNYINSSKPSTGVLIFDWDFHHGNGTQSFVKQYNHEKLFFASMHYYDGKSYPRTGNVSENTDHILNIPFGKGETDDAYLEKFSLIAKPFIERHLNEIDTIIVSNGLDAHKDDPLGLGCLTKRSYVEIAKYFKKTGKKTYFVLEGGYNNQVISDVSDAIISEF